MINMILGLCYFKLTYQIAIRPFECIDSIKINSYRLSKLINNIIACDPEKIERVVLNLISNAIKYS